MKRIKVILVAGARPNFMKIAPLLKELKKYPHKFNPLIVHTGQHYDYEMSKVFFKELIIPEPDIYLGVGSGNHGEQTGKTMIEFEKVCIKENPDLVVVVGDVNSTLAGAIVSSKLHIPLAHIEAGLRSFDVSMPEEINRMLTDQVSDFLFTTCEDGDKNLKKEGIKKERIFLVGDIMIDTLLANRKKIDYIRTYKEMGLESNKYALLTLHRAGNVDRKGNLKDVLSALDKIAIKIPIIFPVHPRTRKKIKEFGFSKHLKRIKTISPLGYLEFQNLLKNSKFVLTDSGGIQEETTVLNIPCLTLRENTERPITLMQGTNILVGSDTKKIIGEALRIIGRDYKITSKCPRIWDGKTSQRIIKILNKNL